MYTPTTIYIPSIDAKDLYLAGQTRTKEQGGAVF